jgi:chromate transporter
MVALLTTVALIFLELSLLSFGGGNTILPEMQRQVVVVHRWLTSQEFSASFALAQAAPGPNMMIVSLLGWRIAGWLGVTVTTLATFGPSFIVTAIAYQLWERFKDRPWRRIVQMGLVPMTAGLVTSSAVIITAGSDPTWMLAGVTAICAVATTTTRIHPLVVLALGAVVGLIGAAA